MTVRYLLLDRKKEAKLEKDEYLVLWYTEYENKDKVFMIVNDGLEFVHPGLSLVKIVDQNLTDYIEKKVQGFFGTYYIHKSIYEYTTRIGAFAERDLWTKSKMLKYFIDNHYEIPNTYTEDVLNLEYKITLIEGYLKFAWEYINIKNKDSGFWEELDFYITDDFDNIIPKNYQKQMNIFELDSKEYDKHLRSFIKNYLYLEKPKEEKSESICETLFKLIDTIFIQNIDKIYRISYGDTVLCIEYEKKIYCLRYSCGS